MREKGRPITPQEIIKAVGTEKESHIVNVLENQAKHAEIRRIKNKTPKEGISIQQEKEAQELFDKMGSNFRNYDISNTIRRADLNGISLMDTIDEAYAEIFGEENEISAQKTEGEKSILKNQMLEKIIKRFEPFLPALDDKEEEKIQSSIDKLQDPLKTRLNTELQKLNDEHTGKVEKIFKKYIEPFMAAKIIREQKPKESPGLLNIDIKSEPETEEIQIQKPTKKPKGLFKRLFG